jgi:hypothetical protein
MVALLAACIFGITVLASGDWLPGAIIVAASVVGVIGQARRLGRGGSGPFMRKPID